MIKYIQIFYGVPELDKMILGIHINLTHKIKALKYAKYDQVNIVVKNGIDGKIETLGISSRICSVNIETNVSLLKDASYSELCIKSYSLAETALGEIWKKKQWDTSDIDHVFKDIKRENFECNIIYFKRVKSKDSKISAELILNVIKDKATFFLRIFDVNVVKELKVISTIANPVLFSRFFHNHFWDKENIYVISDKEREIFIQCDIYNSSVEVKFEERTFKKSDLKSFFDLLFYEDGVDNSLKLYQLPLI